MSNEPGGPAPVPDPYAVPDSTPTAPVPPPAGASPTAPDGAPAAPPALPYGQPVTPYGQAAPGPTPPAYGAPQHGAPPPAASPYGPPQPTAPQYGQPPYGAPPAEASPYGSPQYGSPQYGNPQYGAPSYGPPPYGAQPYGYAQPYAPQPTEGMAIASFVTSTAGLVFLGGLPGPVGLGLGIAALRRIKVSGKGGRGFAIAGIAIGAVGILSMLAVIAYIVFVLALIGSSGGFSTVVDEIEQGTEGSSTLPDFSLRTDLSAGTCLTTYAYNYDMSDTDPVDCAQPHGAEVVALVPMSGAVSLDADDEYDSAYNDAWSSCDEIVEGLVPDYYDSTSGDLELYYPHPDDYAAGRTSAYCVFYSDPGMTGSATAGTLELADAGTSS